jgi:hypothetical protein
MTDPTTPTPIDPPAPEYDPGSSPPEDDPPAPMEDPQEAPSIAPGDDRPYDG